MISRDSKAGPSRQAGFTLIELTVALGVTAIVMLGILFLFDFNNKLARVQTNVADMQQSLRIAQYDMARMVRMAGRGGLQPAGSVTIADNVPEDTRIFDDIEDIDDEESPLVLAGTDVLTMRGVFTTPIFQVAFTNPGAYELTGGVAIPRTPASAMGGSIEICDKTPSGAVQDFAHLRTRILDHEISDSERLVMVSPLDDRFFVVVQVDPAPGATFIGTDTCPVDINGQPTGLTLGFTIDRQGAIGDPYHYGPLSPRLTSDAELGLTRVAYVGFLEEYRFYIQESHAVLGDDDSGLTPVLCRASIVGENVVSCDAIADGVLDLQFALGLDTTNDGTVLENPAAPDTDEWFGNDTDEIAAYDLTSPAYLTFANLLDNNLKSLRISTLVRTRRPDNTFAAEDLPEIENHAYDLSAGADLVNGTTARKYRRRLLQTIVNLRNLTT